jgi:hypothetical protein|tara:strand:- start:62 stop:418 length:357 start_codon:yes stop_codon:yes gene_type:complete
MTENNEKYQLPDISSEYLCPEETQAQRRKRIEMTKLFNWIDEQLADESSDKVEMTKEQLRDARGTLARLWAGYEGSQVGRRHENYHIAQLVVDNHNLRDKLADALLDAPPSLDGLRYS